MVTHVRHTIDRFSVVQRSVLVTGATGALGSAAASALAAPGARLTPAGRLDGVLVAAGMNTAGQVLYLDSGHTAC